MAFFPREKEGRWKSRTGTLKSATIGCPKCFSFIIHRIASNQPILGGGERIFKIPVPVRERGPTYPFSLVSAQQNRVSMDRSAWDAKVSPDPNPYPNPNPKANRPSKENEIHPFWPSGEGFLELLPKRPQSASFGWRGEPFSKIFHLLSG